MDNFNLPPIVKRLKNLLFLFFFLLSVNQVLKAQIDNITYDELFDMILENENHPMEQEKYLKLFLEKAKKEFNHEEWINGYRNYMHYSNYNMSFTYADSMIYKAKETGDSVWIGDAYISRGILYYKHKMYPSAFDDYIEARDYLKNSDDAYLKYKVKYNIGLVKIYLGRTDDAIEMFEECLQYYKKNNQRAYLNSLHCLGICHLQNGDYLEGLTIAENGIRITNGKDVFKMEKYFRMLLGIGQYHTQKYECALQNLNFVIPYLIDSKDFANESLAHYYLGSSFWKLKKEKEAVGFPKKSTV